MMLDTSGLFAFLDPREPMHERAVVLYADAKRRICHNYVSAEFIPLATTRKFDRSLVINYNRDLIHSPEVEYYWIDSRIHLEAIDLLIARPDKSYSLCDAVSFVLMKRLGIVEALTTDRHFEQEGFVRLLT